MNFNSRFFETENLFNGLKIVLCITLFFIVGSNALGNLFIPGTMQEDAFITARYAKNLAEGNGFVFNLDERVLGTTTPGWALLIMPFFKLPVDAQEQAFLLQLFSFLIFYFGVFRLGTSLLFESRMHSLVYFVLVLMHPAMRHAATSGMETSVLVLLTAEAWRILEVLKMKKKLWLNLSLICCLIMAIRLDAVFICMAFGGVYCFKYYQDRDVLKTFTCSVGVAGVGLFLFLMGLQCYFGHWIPQSMLAKTEWSYTEGIEPLQLQGYVDCLKNLLWFNFPWPKFLYPQLVNNVWCGVTAILFGFIWFQRDENHFAYVFSRATICYIALYSSFLFFGRATIFSWYGHVSVFLFYSALVRGLLKFPGCKVLRYCILVSLFIMLSFTQLIELRSLIVSRGQFKPESIEVGNYLKSQNAKTLMTEPIGYLGFFSDVGHVYDLAGLVDNRVFSLRKTKRPGWFSQAVKMFDPEFIVLRKGEVENNLGWNVGVLFAEAQDQYYFEKNYTEIEPRKYSLSRGPHSLAIYRRCDELEKCNNAKVSE